MNLNLFKTKQVPKKEMEKRTNTYKNRTDSWKKLLNEFFFDFFPLSTSSLMLPKHHRLTSTGRTTKEFCRYKSGASVPNCWRWMWCLEGMVGWRFFLIGIYYSTSTMFNDLFLILFYLFFFWFLFLNLFSLLWWSISLVDFQQIIVFPVDCLQGTLQRKSSKNSDGFLGTPLNFPSRQRILVFHAAPKQQQLHPRWLENWPWMKMYVSY